MKGEGEFEFLRHGVHEAGLFLFEFVFIANNRGGGRGGHLERTQPTREGFGLFRGGARKSEDGLGVFLGLLGGTVCDDFEGLGDLRQEVDLVVTFELALSVFVVTLGESSRCDFNLVCFRKVDETLLLLAS